MKSLKELQKTLDENNRLEVQLKSDFIVQYEFKWNKGANDTQLQKISDKCPTDYVDFLKFTNGAILYYDTKYGQWGYEFFSIEQMLKETISTRDLGYELPESCFVIARCFGDSDLILINLENSSIIYGEGSLPYKEWETIATTFEEFIDKLIASKGNKYWE